MNKYEYFRNLSKKFSAFNNISLNHINENNFEDIYNNMPITSKKNIREQYTSYISRDLLRFIDDGLLENIFDVKNITGNHDKVVNINQNSYTIEYTTGATGKPFPVIKSNLTRFIQGKYLLNLRRNHYEISDYSQGLLFLHSNDDFIKSINLFDFEKEDLKIIINKLQKSNISWMFGTPLIFRKISEYAEQNKIEINNVKFIEYTSQILTDKDEIIKSTFPEAQLISNYGTREFWNIGFGQQDKYLTINNNYLIVDLINESGNIVKNLNELGDIIVTDMSNNCQAFVKYLTGDKGKYIVDINGNIKLKLIDNNKKNTIEGSDINGDKIFRRVMRGIYFHDYIDNVFKILIIQKKIFQFDVFISSNIIPNNNFETRFKYRTELILPNFSEYKFNFIYSNDFKNTKNYKEFIFINQVGEN